MSNIFFSIIIPVYKPQFLKECIDSILAQTYRNFELILVNDGSPYDIDSIVGQYQDSRIEYHKREKGYGAVRLVDNWNDCLKYVKGQYVINMGDDDKLLPNCLVDYVKLMKEYPGLDIYHMRTVFIDGDSQVIGYQQEAPEYESVWSFMWHVWNGRQTMIGDFLFRVSALREAGGFYYLPLAWHSDKIAAFKAAIAHGIANTSEPGFCFRRSPYHISADTKVTEQKAELWQHEIRNWYTQFFHVVQPISTEDKCYRAKLEAEFNFRIKDWMFYDIKADVSSNPLRWFHWLKYRKKYGLTYKNMANLMVNGAILKR